MFPPSILYPPYTTFTYLCPFCSLYVPVQSAPETLLVMATSLSSHSVPSPSISLPLFSYDIPTAQANSAEEDQLHWNYISIDTNESPSYGDPEYQYPNCCPDCSNHKYNKYEKYDKYDKHEKYDLETLDCRYRREAQLAAKRCILYTPQPPMPNLQNPHFLSLPKELRMKIYSYIFPARTQLIIISPARNPSFFKTAPHSRNLFQLVTSCIQSFTHPTHHHHCNTRTPHPLSLLHTNTQIYKEVLPLLYSKAIFAIDPSDQVNTLSLFLAPLSPYAQSCIRTLRLYLPHDISSYNDGERTSLAYTWSSICTTITKHLPDLQTLEIHGKWGIFEDIVKERGEWNWRDVLLFPLCGIRCWKRFVPAESDAADEENIPGDYDIRFQFMLLEAAQRLEKEDADSGLWEEEEVMEDGNEDVVGSGVVRGDGVGESEEEWDIIM